MSDPSRVADHLADIPPRRTCQTLRDSVRHQAGDIIEKCSVNT